MNKESDNFEKKITMPEFYYLRISLGIKGSDK